MNRRRKIRIGCAILLWVCLSFCACGKEAEPTQPVASPHNTGAPEETVSATPTDTAAAAISQRNDLLLSHGLMDIRQAIPDAIIDLRYATDNNFTGQQIYPVDECLLSIQTGNKLVAAADELREKGYRLKVFDAYRPKAYQQILYDAAPDKKYVANPDGKGSNHTRAAAIDMTICTMDGEEVPMPSGFDDLSDQASRSQEGLDEDVAQSLRMVEDVMTRHGFRPLGHEWWHYDDTDYASMPFLEVELSEFALE